MAHIVSTHCIWIQNVYLRSERLSLSSAEFVYIRETVIIVSAYLLAPKGAWPSEITMLTAKLDMFPFCWLS